MSIASDMVAQLARVVSTQGHTGRLMRAANADLPGDGVPVRFLMRHPGVRDDAVVNSYGVNAQIITLPHTTAFAAVPPEKFDLIEEDPPGPGARRYVFDAVLPREVGGMVVAWTAFVRGKGA